MSVSLPRSWGTPPTSSSRAVFTGSAIDFAHLGRILGLALRAARRRHGPCSTGCPTSSPASCSARCTDLRADVEDKLNRLPLSYVDRAPRGDLLSRVTNDIDNIAQSLQQTLSQMLTQVLTLIGTVAMMIWISLAARARRARHHPGVDGHDEGHRQALADAVHRPVDAHRRAQRPGRGDLHRPCHRQGVRTPARGRGTLPRNQRRAVRGQLRSPVHLRRRSSRRRCSSATSTSSPSPCSAGSASPTAR